MPPERNPTETSPLLGPQGNGSVAIPNTGVTGPPYVESAQHADHSHANGEPGQTKAVLDARQQLKLIVPAVSIGVCHRTVPLAGGEKTYSMPIT